MTSVHHGRYNTMIVSDMVAVLILTFFLRLGVVVPNVEQSDYFVDVTDVQIKKQTPAIRTLSVKAPVRPAHRNHIHGKRLILFLPPHP